MIVGERKPVDEVMKLVEPYEKILVLGCGTCVTVSFAGGDREVSLLKSALNLKCKREGISKDFSGNTIKRQCEREFFEPITEEINQADAVLSLACGAGVQFLAELFPEKVILPAVNTMFIGVNQDVGVWDERCRMCGDCVLAETAAICPITQCPKGLVNGPCGGTNNGKCEVDRQKDCAWTLIYRRLEKQGKLDNIRKVFAPKKHSAQLHPAVQVSECYEKAEMEGE